MRSSPGTYIDAAPCLQHTRAPSDGHQPAGHTHTGVREGPVTPSLQCVGALGLQLLRSPAPLLAPEALPWADPAVSRCSLPSLLPPGLSHFSAPPVTWAGAESRCRPFAPPSSWGPTFPPSPPQILTCPSLRSLPLSAWPRPVAAFLPHLDNHDSLQFTPDTWSILAPNSLSWRGHLSVCSPTRALTLHSGRVALPVLSSARGLGCAAPSPAALCPAHDCHPIGSASSRPPFCPFQSAGTIHGNCSWPVWARPLPLPGNPLPQNHLSNLCPLHRPFLMAWDMPQPLVHLCAVSTALHDDPCHPHLDLGQWKHPFLSWRMGSRGPGPHSSRRGGAE